jgi:hypothetical protein
VKNPSKISGINRNMRNENSSISINSASFFMVN